MLKRQGSTWQEELQQVREFKTIFGSIDEGAFIYDSQGEITLINPAAIKLLGLTSEADCLGHPYTNYIHLYENACGYEMPIPDALGPLAQVIMCPEPRQAQAHHVLLQQTDGEKVEVDIFCAPLLNLEGQPIEGICLIHPVQRQQANGQQAQQISQVLSALMSIISPTPGSSLEEQDELDPLLAPGKQEIAQSITDFLKSQLACNYVSVAVLNVAEDRLNIIALSGLSPQQRRRIFKATQKYPLSSFVNPITFRQLLLKKITIIPREQLSLPAYLHLDEGPQNLLYVPLLVNPRSINCLLIGKDEQAKTYSPEEMEQVKAIAVFITLIIRQFRLRIHIIQVETSAKALQATNYRINEFLNQASHELRTPLTVRSYG